MTENIQNLKEELRVFPPPAAASKRAHVPSMDVYKKMWKESIDNPDKFFGDYAGQFHWFKKWDKVSEWKAPFAKWFIGGKTNLSYNCLDRHLTTKIADKRAIIWVGEPENDTRTLTYRQLHAEVCKAANAFKSIGLKKGDRVAVYMGMTPELVITLLACARIGVIHSVVFGGFSAQSLTDRINDSECKAVITADGSYRRGKIVELKKAVDEAIQKCPCVQHVIVHQRTKHAVAFQAGRDLWWHDLMAKASADCKAEEMDSEDLLFLLYTSGTTGKPKGIMHTTGGYMVGTAMTTKYVFDLHDDDVYWCTADIGWVTGHSYIVYGPLNNGATSLIFEGAPNHPNPDRFWQVIEQYKVTVFYTAPTAIRAFMKWGDEWVTKHNLSSLRTLGTVGEPINPEAWMWYHKMIGGERCPIVDTWWQTETGGIMITPFPGATPTKPGTATLPFFGIDPDIVDEKGNSLGAGEGGYLVIKKPWPSMTRGIWGDQERFKTTYWEKFAYKYYWTGDGAYRDKDGYYWIIGRLDDVLNVSGHRLGTAEIESALVSHPSVAEAAVVGFPHDLKGQGIAAFVTLKLGQKATEELKVALGKHVTKEIGSLARPDQLRFSEVLPKTRSGKIMRRLLRDVAAGKKSTGDTSTLEDFSALEKLYAGEE
ncbi:MAG TPA: acetate--CoA ligase [Planctomycetota bacterium]|nr:acetate--CoA ligase [Planctomycetota bacterium]